MKEFVHYLRHSQKSKCFQLLISKFLIFFSHIIILTISVHEHLQVSYFYSTAVKSFQSFIKIIITLSFFSYP